MRLLVDREDELHAQGISFRITGIASRRLGWLAKIDGFNPRQLNEPSPADGLWDKSVQRASNVRSWLRAAETDVLFEATSLNVANGEPAVDHLHAALEHGAHAITANKGPIVHAYAELEALAQRHKRSFLFESTVMDGVPIFSLFRENLPALRLQGFRGILNSTTNVILSGMEEGLSFDDALLKAQQLGVAETDATHDIDGWDATVKVAALVTVLMNEPIRLKAIHREGIRHLSGEQVRAARKAGTPYKLVCEAKRGPQGIEARVAPEQLPLTDALAHVTGTSSIIEFHTDIFPALVLTEENPGVYATAYGMLADFIRAVRT